MVVLAGPPVKTGFRPWGSEASGRGQPLACHRVGKGRLGATLLDGRDAGPVPT